MIELFSRLYQTYLDFRYLYLKAVFLESKSRLEQRSVIKFFVATK